MARRPAGQDHDPSRREFFKTFSREAIQNAGAVAGAAAELRRTSLETARELLDFDTPPATKAPTTGRVAGLPALASAPQATFRSAYRFTGTSVIVLDQRELPSRVVTFECRTANDVAAALRSGAVSAGPVMGQIAAYGVALAASGAEAGFNSSVDSIKAARGEVNAVRSSVRRMMARYNELANSGTPVEETRDELVAEADQIASEATAACAEIGRRWSKLPVGADRLNIVMHGGSGPLTCGMVGMSTSGLRSLIDGGRDVHVWVTEASPGTEGTRIVARELTQLDIAHTVVPDSALGWLFANRRIGAVVLRGDSIANNGDTVALLGARAAAQLAIDADVQVHVLAPEVSWDRAAPDTSHLVLDVRSGAELGSADRARLDPSFDIVPARLVSAYVSENAVVSPPFKEPR